MTSYTIEQTSDFGRVKFLEICGLKIIPESNFPSPFTLVVWTRSARFSTISVRKCRICSLFELFKSSLAPIIRSLLICRVCSGRGITATSFTM